MPISKGLRYQVLQRDRFTCRYCGARPPKAVLVIDHVIPRKRGGKDDLSNLTTACDDCNAGKSASMPEPWLVTEVLEAAATWAPVPNPGDGLELSADELGQLAEEWRITEEFFKFLVALSAREVLHYAWRAFSAAYPYRPTYDEVIRAAGGIAARELTEVNLAERPQAGSGRPEGD